MKILFIADIRSDHARNWINYVKDSNEVILLSTYRGKEIENVKTYFIPSIFTLGDIMVTSEFNNNLFKKSRYKLIFLNLLSIPIIFKLSNYFWQQIKIIELPFQLFYCKKIIKKYNPKIVHSLRTQNEGYIAALSNFHPVINSSWGSDFIYTAKYFPLHNLLTKICVKKFDIFFSDNNRDLLQAFKFGLKRNAITKIFPGNGGVDLKIFNKKTFNNINLKQFNIVYLRGFSEMARIDTLLKSLYLLINEYPYIDIKLNIVVPHSFKDSFKKMCINNNLNMSNICIHTNLSKLEVSNLLKLNDVFVSPMMSDGLPNSMLESMACGVFPIMSFQESIKDIITHKVNGLFFDPSDHNELYDCFSLVIKNMLIIKNASIINYDIIESKFEYNTNMNAVINFYKSYELNNI